MTFIILAIMVFLIVIVFRKYRSVLSVIVAILLATGITTACLVAGLTALEGNRSLVFFTSALGRQEFMYLMIAWYGADFLCSILIIRNHIAYRKVNK